MHWMTACADCGQTLRVQDRLGQSILCPRCGRGVTASRPPEPCPAAQASRRRWPWVVGVGLGVALASAVLATTLLKVHSSAANPAPSMSSMPSPPLLPTLVDPTRGSQAPPPPARPARLIPVLQMPDAADGSLRPIAQEAPALKPAGRIAPLLALAGGPDGTFLTGDGDGVLRCYGPSLELRGEARLDRVPYLMALDHRRGRLYAAVALRRTLRLSPLGDREQAMGDLCVYDVSSLLAGRAPPDELAASHTEQLESQVTGLHLSQDGAYLCYLADSMNGAHLGRLETSSMQCQRQRVLASGMSGLADLGGGSLVALAGGILFRIDLPTWTITRSAAVGGSLMSVHPAGGTKVFLLERRPGAFVVLLDVETNEVISRYAAPYAGRFTLRTTPGRLYVGTSAVLDGRVEAFDHGGGSYVARGGARRDGRLRLLRGGLHLTPDGRHLVTGNGHVFGTP